MIADLMRTIGREARAAAPVLELSSSEVKNRALRAAAASLRARRHKILAANDRDVRAPRKATPSTGAMLERLKLDEKRVEAMARALEDVERLPDPIGTVLAEWTRPNGMVIQRRRVPLGVIGIIYESRPNVTADAGALCLKSGQRRDPARRLRERPFERGHSRVLGRGVEGGRVCRAAASNSCPRPTGRRSATCCPR